MLYDEFLQGTGCRQTTKNYEVYKELENIYMQGDLSKEEIYAIGKMRVDNSLTEDEQEEIKTLECGLNEYMERMEYIKNYTYYGTYKEIQEQHKQHVIEIQDLSREIKIVKEQIKSIKDRAK